jgi:hypothetical protein
MGNTPVVLKVGDPNDENGDSSRKALWAEARLYEERLEGLEGVPKLLAKGWIERSPGDWCPALLMESLGEPITESDLNELSAKDRCVSPLFRLLMLISEWTGSNLLLSKTSSRKEVSSTAISNLAILFELRTTT